MTIVQAAGGRRNPIKMYSIKLKLYSPKRSTCNIVHSVLNFQYL